MIYDTFDILTAKSLFLVLFSILQSPVLIFILREDQRENDTFQDCFLRYYCDTIYVDLSNQRCYQIIYIMQNSITYSINCVIGNAYSFLMLKTNLLEIC